MKLTQHACYVEQLKRMYYTSFSNVKNYSRRECFTVRDQRYMAK
jgi:hypothetical protein